MSAVAAADPEPAPGSDKQHLCCEFCLKAEFEAREEKAEHEQHCDAARVTVRIPKPPTHKHQTGLTEFCECESHVRIGQGSEIFQYADEIRALATALFPPASEHWAQLDDDTFNALVDFGRKYMRQQHWSVKPFNDGTMRAALLQMMKPGDIVESVKYTNRYPLPIGAGRRPKKETLCLKDVDEDRRDKRLTSILNDEESFPLELSVKRMPRTQNQETKQGYDPLKETTKLNLKANDILCRIDWNGFAGRLRQFTFLKELDLEKCWIGRDGCRALATLLREDSPLEWLSLKSNLVDDECVSMIVEALEDNTTLKNLYLNKNDAITGRGQDDLFDLVGAGPTIHDAYLSNHTIRCLNWDYTDSEHHAAADAPEDLKIILGINRSRNDYDPGRQKVWFQHFGDNRLNLEPFLEMNVATVPHFLAWITMIYDSDGERRFRPQFSNEGEHLRHVYHFVRDWNVPALFGFLSADRSRILELEELVRTLKAQNNKLTKEISELREENCALKGEGTASAKRKRGN